MQSFGASDPDPPSSRQMQPRESEAEHRFWCRYWELLRSKGIPVGREIWYERSCARFIRELKPRRLKEATLTLRRTGNSGGLILPREAGRKSALGTSRGRRGPSKSGLRGSWCCAAVVAKPLKNSRGRAVDTKAILIQQFV